MNAVTIAMALAAALAVYTAVEYFDCALYPGTDTCVECTNDCLDPMEDPR